jgi:hypothetical protein
MYLVGGNLHTGDSAVTEKCNFVRRSKLKVRGSLFQAFVKALKLCCCCNGITAPVEP